MGFDGVDRSVCTGVFFEALHQAEESKLSRLRREITDSRVGTRQELDALYRNIITYILLRSAMGSPTDASSVEEAAGLKLPLSLFQLQHRTSFYAAALYTKGCATRSTPKYSSSY